MNCKNCKNWVFGRCVVSNLVTGPGQLCNAWELSASYEQVKLPYATFDEKEFQKRIAELEALIGKLIEIGEWGLTGMVIAASFSGGEIHDLAERRQNEWLTLVKDWKEREE